MPRVNRKAGPEPGFFVRGRCRSNPNQANLLQSSEVTGHSWDGRMDNPFFKLISCRCLHNIT